MAYANRPWSKAPRTIAGGMPVHAEIRRNATLVGFAGVAFLVLQVAAGGLVRPLGPAELALLPGTPPTGAVRAAAMLLSTGALIVTFRVWVRPAGRVAAAAAAFFAASWLPVVAGPMVATPLYATFAVVAAAGFVTRWLYERDRGALVGAAVTTALATWWQPAAGAGLATALVGVLLVWGRKGALPGVLSVALGGFTGGLLAAALPATNWTVSVGTTDWWARVALSFGVAAILMLVAVVEQRWPHRRNAAVVTVAVAVVVAIGVALLEATPAGLLPAFGVLCVAAGSGVLASWHAVRRMSTIVPTVALVAAAVGLAVLQLVFAVQADGELTAAPATAPASAD